MRRAASCVICAWLSGLATVSLGASPEVLPLIPWPKTISERPGALDITPSNRIVIASRELMPLGRALAEDIGRLTGLRLAVAEGAEQGGDIVLAVDPSLAAEGRYFPHAVDIDTSVKIRGADYASSAMGTVSLLQLLRSDKTGVHVPRVTLADYSPAPYTGMMLDVARQGNSLDVLRDCVTLCRLYKVRYFHLHLNDMESFTFESKLFPKLGSHNRSAHGGPTCELYSRDKLEEFIHYADERGVAVVPELETVFHTGAMMADMPDVFGGPGVLDMTSENMYAALDALIGEMCDVFKSSPYFHIGCDEASIGGLANQPTYKEYMEKHKLKDLNDLYAHHIERLDEVIRKKGKRTIVWQDSPLPKAAKVIVMAWRIDWNHGGAVSYMKDGYPTIQVTWTPSCGWPVKDLYAWRPFDDEVKPGEFGFGSQLVLWEQNGSVAIPFLRQKMPARQERTHSPDADRTYEDFGQRLTTVDSCLDPLTTGLIVRENGLKETVPQWIRNGGSGNTPDFSFAKDLEVAFACNIPRGVVRYTVTEVEKYHPYRFFGVEPSNTSERVTGPVKIGATKGEAVALLARVFDTSGKPMASTWTRVYKWEPFVVTVKNSVSPTDFRFSQPVTVTVGKVAPNGVVRCQTDGALTSHSPVADKPLTITNNCELTLGFFDVEGTLRGLTWKGRFSKVDYDPANLTFGKPVACTASVGTPMLAFVTDGVIDRDQHADLGGGKPSTTVDLGGVHTLNRIVLYTYWDGGRYYQYTLEVSEDGKTWKMAADAQENKTPATEKGYEHTFAPMKAAAIRITMLHNSANIGKHIVEVRAYEVGR